MRPFRHPRPLSLLLPFLLLTLAGGCARQPPGEGGNQAFLSGRRLRVTLTFDTAVQSYYYYYFLINAKNDQSAPGPIPVGEPQPGSPYYSNGFATGSRLDASNLPNGFTDFVLFTDQQQYPGSVPRNGFGLYHVPQIPTSLDSNDRRNFQFNGTPISFTRPSVSQDDPGSKVITFDIDLAQLFPEITDQVQLLNKVNNLKFVQFNMVATNNIPTDPQTQVSKQYDSFGNNTRSAQGNYLTLDVSQNILVESGNSVLAADASEPTGNDNDGFVAYPPGAPQDRQLNLVNWKIEVLQQ